MKFVSLIALVMMASCTHHGPSRDLASSDPICHLEKHPSKNHYKVMMNESEYNEYWYTKQYAQSLVDKFKSQGKCE